MNLLLDTHTALWWLSRKGKVSQPVRALLRDPATVVFLSAASVWEMSIKARSGKLIVPQPLLDDVDAFLSQLAWQAVPVLARHGVLAGQLPGAHKDPFDRMLAAQARLEGLTVATSDPAIAGLGAAVVW